MKGLKKITPKRVTEKHQKTHTTFCTTKRTNCCWFSATISPLIKKSNEKQVIDQTFSHSTHKSFRAFGSHSLLFHTFNGMGFFFVEKNKPNSFDHGHSVTVKWIYLNIRKCSYITMTSIKTAIMRNACVGVEVMLWIKSYVVMTELKNIFNVCWAWNALWAYEVYELHILLMRVLRLIQIIGLSKFSSQRVGRYSCQL